MLASTRRSHTYRSVAFAVSIDTQISDYHTLCVHLYGELRDPQVRASITQAAIRDGVSAANAYRTATKNAAGKPPSEPEFERPVVKLNSQSWRLNKIAEGYIAEANIGSRESPLYIMINVPCSVAKRVEGYEPGELWITPDTYTITYSKKVSRVQRPVPSGKSTVAELVAGVGRVNDPPKNIIAVDLNAENITTGDGYTIVQFDLSKSINSITSAKKRDADDTIHDRTRDDIRYKNRTGREVSHEREEERLAKQKVLHGGPRLYKKLKRRWDKLKSQDNIQEAAEVKARMDKCVLTTKHSHTKQRKDSKPKTAAKASHVHYQRICTIALTIVYWAVASDSLIVLENLRGMFEGWSKQKGVFGRGLRRKLYSAAIMKMSDKIWDTAPKYPSAEGVLIISHFATCRCYPH